jgi:cold shock CspA family protein
VYRVYPERSFGFIRCREAEQLDLINRDLFFHATGLDDCRIDELQEGGPVEFEPHLVAKGWRAEHITRVP